MTSVEELVNEYLQWLKENITLGELDGWFEVTTPFLDRHNDHLQVYVKADGNEFVLTDDGYVVKDLAMTGCEASTPRRRELLETTLAGFELQDQALTTRATHQNSARKKHALLQAMLAVNHAAWHRRQEPP